MEIRRVTDADDFEKIGNIYAQSWKTAYKGIIPQDFLDSLPGIPPLLAQREYSTYVVLDGGTYIGTSSFHAARDANMNGWGEIISIYLLPEYFGKGYAAPLLRAVVAALSSQGFERIYLWVLEENARARRFYENNGFQCTSDTTKITLGGKELVEIRYVYNV